MLFLGGIYVTTATFKYQIILVVLKSLLCPALMMLCFQYLIIVCLIDIEFLIFI